MERLRRHDRLPGPLQAPSVEKPKQVFITAISPGSNRSSTKSVTVVKHKFRIDAPGNPASELYPGQDQKLAIAPPLPAAEPAGAVTFASTPAAGETVKGTVSSSGTVIAAHLHKGKARFEIQV
jgi:hypothetical protein